MERVWLADTLPAAVLMWPKSVAPEAPAVPVAVKLTLLPAILPLAALMLVPLMTVSPAEMVCPVRVFVPVVLIVKLADKLANAVMLPLPAMPAAVMLVAVAVLLAALRLTLPWAAMMPLVVKAFCVLMAVLAPA